MRFALIAGALVGMLAASVSAAADSTVLTYHGALDRSGNYVMPGLTYERARGLHPDLSFNAAYRGEVYAQPLLWRDPKTGAGELIVATEEDEVYAFDEKTGARIWMTTLGEPVMNAAAGGFRCGDIWPLGVSGTPVIDKGRATVYLDAMVVRDSHARHRDVCAFARRRVGRARLAGRCRDCARREFRPDDAESARRARPLRRAGVCSL